MDGSFKRAMKKLFGPPGTGSLPEDGMGRTPLTYAILHHQREEALSLLRQCGDVNHRDSGGYTDLYFAAQSGELEVLRELLRRGADPNLGSYAGAVPLTAAMDSAQRQAEREGDAYDRAFEMVRLLVEAGADPDRRSRSGSTPRQLSKYMAPGPIAGYLRAAPVKRSDEM